MNDPACERDFYAWTEAQVAALRAKDLTALDVDHLSEQIVNRPPGAHLRPGEVWCATPRGAEGVKE